MQSLPEQPRPDLLRQIRARWSAWLCCLGAVLLPLAAAGAAPQDVDEEEREVRSFAIPETSRARNLMQVADEHLAAERYGEAINSLQALLENHSDEVLPGRFEDEQAGWTSQQRVHPGAGPQARRMLENMPAEARELYAERFSAPAAAALDRALRRGWRSELVEVTRLWPLTEAARRAWWALGDLELEAGHRQAAQTAWERAAEATRRDGSQLKPGALQRLQMVRDWEAGEAAESSKAATNRGLASAAEPPGPRRPKLAGATRRARSAVRPRRSRRALEHAPGHGRGPPARLRLAQSLRL